MSEALIRNCKTVYELSKTEQCSEELKNAIQRMHSFLDTLPQQPVAQANSFTGSRFVQGSLFGLAGNIHLDKPNTLFQHIFHDLLVADEICERDYQYNSFRQRLSEVRSALKEIGVEIKSQQYEYKNGNGNNAWYLKHYLYTIEKQKAAELYQSLYKKSSSRGKKSEML